MKSFLVMLQFNAVCLAAEEGEKTYAQLANLFQKVVRRRMRFTWSWEMDESFLELKKRLSSDQVMVPYEVGRQTSLDCDSSLVGTQAMVSQLQKHPKLRDTLRLINHRARAWNKSERGYIQIERESNGVCNGVVSNRMYLLGQPFMVMVDHRPLISLYDRFGRPMQSRVGHHRIKLEAYRFNMKWEAGNKNPCDYGWRHPPEGRETRREDNTELYVSCMPEGPAATSAKEKDAVQGDAE